MPDAAAPAAAAEFVYLSHRVLKPPATNGTPPFHHPDDDRRQQYAAGRIERRQFVNVTNESPRRRDVPNRR
jgi:hypothetical protein